MHGFPLTVRMPLLRRLVLLALVACASALSAQGVVRIGRAGTGRVRGIVIDSLLGAPLPGATVRIVQLGHSVISDSAGRFVIDSVPPGEWTVAFRHPALDSLGFSEAGTPVRLFVGASAVVTLATSSFATFRGPFCEYTPDSLSATVAYGGVYAIDSTRVHVNVAVSWLSVDTEDGVPRAGTVRTVPEGDRQMWVACGIPWGAWIHASVKDSSRAASALLQMGPRGITTHALVLASGTTVLTGTVRDESGTPIQGARASVVDSDAAAVSDATGTFAIASAPNGTITLDVRAAGHRPWIGALEGGPRAVEVRMQPLTTPDTDAPRGSDYLRLLQRGNRPGLQLLTSSDFAADSTPLATLVPQATCRWWLDGRPVTREFFLAQPRRSWRALETYAQGADAPPEYRAPGCAVALLWTAAADW